MTTKPQIGMRKLAVTLALLCGAFAQAPAQAQNGVYLCTNANGGRELTDSYKPGCKTLNLPGSIPAPQQSRERRATAPRAPVATPQDFPKVDNAQQKARDNDRREILNEELRMEEKKLADARREFNGGEPERQGNERNYAKYQERVEMMRDSISRIEKNIEALKREIANIK
ncbi:MAG: DUF4124 domain-containing protein [Telluria sp.]